jgi:hypothetical protein
LSVPAEFGGGPLSWVERGGGNLAQLPAVEAHYLEAPFDYELDLVDLPITSHELDGKFGTHDHRDVQHLLQAVGRVCSPTSACGPDQLVFGGHALVRRLDGTVYGCVPINQPTTTVDITACVWIDARSFAILWVPSSGVVDQGDLLVAMRRAHDEAIAGPVASCDLPSLAGCPPSPPPPTPVGNGRPSSPPGS